MRSLLNKIKNTFFSVTTPEEREEAMIRIRFLEYLTFDVEFYGSFYNSSAEVLDRHAQLIEDNIGVVPCNETEKRIIFLEEALADMIQLEFDSWSITADIESCGCETYYSFRGWYNFNFIAKGLLETNSTSQETCHNSGSKYLVAYLISLTDSGKRDLGIQ